MLVSSVLFIAGIVAIVVVCVLLEVYKWRIDRVMGPEMGRPAEVPVLGVGHRFIGKDNEGLSARSCCCANNIYILLYIYMHIKRFWH